MTLIALDPSSTRTGYAVFEDEDTLIDFGAWKPPVTKGGVKWEAHQRVYAMTCSLEVLCNDHRPYLVVVESPSGKVANRSKASMGAGLALYGEAVGFMRGWMQAMGIKQQRVTEREWTRGVSKKVRARRIAAAFPAYAGVKDSGLDIADAIGLGAWWFANERLMAAQA